MRSRLTAVTKRDEARVLRSPPSGCLRYTARSGMGWRVGPSIVPVHMVHVRHVQMFVLLRLVPMLVGVLTEKGR